MNYRVYELEDVPNGCISCSLLTISNDSGFYQFMITPSIVDKELSDHISHWSNQQAGAVLNIDIEAEIERYLTIEYKVYVTFGRNVNPDFDDGDDVPVDSYILFESVKNPDVLITVLPSIEDIELRSYIIDILEVRQFTDADSDISYEIAEWIEDRIDDYQASRS